MRKRMIRSAMLLACCAAAVATAFPAEPNGDSPRTPIDAGQALAWRIDDTFSCDVRLGADLFDDDMLCEIEFPEKDVVVLHLPNGDVARLYSQKRDIEDGHRLNFFQMTLRNDTDKDRIVDKLRPIEIVINRDDNVADPESPIEVEPKAFGTAGLTPVDGHNGSYAFLAVAYPETRAGLVTGWVTGERGSGVVFSDMIDDKPHVTAQIDYGKLRIPPHSSVTTEILAFGWFDDARLGLEAYADAVAKHYEIELPPCPTGYCTWYSNPHGGACDEVHLVELAEAAAEKLVPYGFDFIQIDDKWQQGERRNGPAKCFFSHRKDGPYPHGMKAAADHIRSLGMTPGIWFMPFAADRQDPFFLEHEDWFVQHQGGTPYWVRWGGTSLDMTDPNARKYVRDLVRRIANDWGYRYFKLDGLWTGSATELLYVNNEYKEDDIGQAVFHDPYKTNIEVYRDGLKLVREAAGSDVFLLGCNVSQNMRTLGGSYGLVDAMRIGPDNGPGFQSLKRGPWHGTNRYFLHGRVWYNDPDPIYVRASMPIDHARLVGSWVAISGQLGVFSEWLPGLPPERLDLLRRTMPNHGLRPRPVDLFEEDIARIWLLTQESAEDGSTPRRDVVGLFNWQENESAVIDESMERIGLSPEKEYVGFDYWDNRFVPPFSERLTTTLEPGSCRVVSLREACDHPVLVSTSRHITQGMVDVVEERWDAETNILHGVSRVVAGEPYELRITVPTGENSSYRFAEATLSEADDAKAVEIGLVETNGAGLRVSIHSRVSRSVAWSIRFAKAVAEQ